MPPKARITKEMILDVVLEITRENGFETVNARSIASKLQCSTRPIFTCYGSMEELKSDFLDFAFKTYERYVADYGNSVQFKPYLLLPLPYIAFAKEETHLFQLLFISDMDLDMKAGRDFYNEIGNEAKAKEFAEMVGIELEAAKGIFFNLFLYSHGIAVLTATKKMAVDQDHIEKMVANFLSVQIKQVKPDWNLTI